MSSDPQHDGTGADWDFVAAWLREQRALWQRFAANGEASDFAAAQAAWDAACERWWQQVGSAVPAPMAAPVRAALDHTRLLVRIACGLAGGGSPSSLEAVINPAQLFSAALDAITCAPPHTRDMDAERAYTRDTDAERAYTRTYAALVAVLADIAHEAFDAARTSLAREPAHTAQDLYARYAEAIETHYRARAGSDEFARLVGAMINAQVDALAARRRVAP